MISTPFVTKKTRASAFTLVELMVVIAIMGIIMSVGIMGLSSMMSGQNVPTSVATSEALFNEGRTIALAKKTDVRMLIDASNPKDGENYLRRVLMIYREVNASGELTDNWVLGARAARFSPGVFYSQAYSSQDHENGFTELPKMELGSQFKKNYRGKYYYYEFNADGVCTFPGSSFILGLGTRPGAESNPRPDSKAKKDFGGFVIYRNGSTSIYQSPEQMKIPDKIKQF